MRLVIRLTASKRTRGFVLLAVLWVIVGATTLGLAVALAARSAVRGARNRRRLSEAEWVAEDCLSRTEVEVADVLGGASEESAGGRDAGWGALDRAVAGAPLLDLPGCRVQLRAAGSTIDLNAASGDLLRSLLHSLAVPAARADSLADALLDWRDPDDVPRALGAESEWYVEHGERPPRNGALADIRELRRVRGFGELAGLDSVLGVEPGRIALNHAPLSVIAALPGMTSEALDRLAERRARGMPVTSLLTFSATLSPEARAALLARYLELSRLTTTEPDAWIVTVRAARGTPPVTAVLEVRLVKAGTRAAIVRRRTWVE